MTPQVTLDPSTLERMKKYAEPLVDTPDSVINRGLDAIDTLQAKSDTLPTERIFNPESPPNLAYTTLKSVIWNGERLPATETYWNPLMFKVIREASKTLTRDNMRMMILALKCSGPKEDEGYKYIQEIDMSVQGQNANNAWRTAYNLIKFIKLPIEVEFVWQDNPKAVSPGAVGKFVVAFD